MKYKNSKVTEEESEQIRNLSLSGKTASEISKITGRSMQCVYDNLPASVNSQSEPKYIREQIEEEKSVAEHRERIAEIAKEFAEMHRNDRYYLSAA